MSEHFPRLTPAALSGEAGMNLVASCVGEMGWVFRRTHGEHDFGIDGYIDLVTPDGRVTGRCLAVQVKHGASYLSHRTTDGFVYYGKKRHLSYLMNHPVPVIIILCDPVTRLCYWEHFQPELTEPTETGWKLIVPFASQLGPQSRERLTVVAGPAHDHAEELEHYWAVSRALATSSLVVYDIGRQDIERGDFSMAVSFFKNLQRTKDFARRSKGKVELVVSGYDADPRELWQIPEVIRWFRQVEPLVKYWFFFLASEPPVQGLAMLTMCICDAQWVAPPEPGAIGKRPVQLDQAKFEEFLYRNYGFLNEIAENIGVPEYEIEELSARIERYLMPGAQAGEGDV